MFEIIANVDGQLRAVEMRSAPEAGSRLGDWVVDVAQSRSEAELKIAESLDRSRGYPYD